MNSPKSAAASSKTPRRVGLISLGCAKNLVDAEIMLGSLLKSGVEIVNDPAQADAVIDLWRKTGGDPMAVINGTAHRCPDRL